MRRSINGVRFAEKEMDMDSYERYQSPYSWRYGSPEMRQIWSEVHKRRWWRRIWLALAEVQGEYGLVSDAQVEELRAHVDQVDVQRSLEVEAEIQHDLMAELKVFAAQCPGAAGILHLGATSMDVKDNAAACMSREALAVILQRMENLLHTLADLMESFAEFPTLGFTHLQPAEPTTVGYRLASYGQDLWEDYHALSHHKNDLRGKGFTGAVGTSASYHALLEREELGAFQARLSDKLDLDFYPVVTQTYPRRQEYHLVTGLASVGAVMYKLAFDLRILQSPPFGEWSEPFGEDQIGSSAMPFKKNPIRSEKINSLARMLAQLPRVAWDNAAHSLLERTLDDSANRRSLLPEAFLITDELLSVSDHVLRGLEVYQGAVSSHLEDYGPFAATEPLLMALSKSGADRQVMHERLRRHALQAWSDVQDGRENPLLELVLGDQEIRRHLSAEEIRQVMDIQGYIGDAPQRARGMAQQIREGLR